MQPSEHPPVPLPAWRAEAPPTRSRGNTGDTVLALVLLAATAVASGAMALSSCGRDELVAPRGPSVISLTADPASLTLGGKTSALKALVRDSQGNAVADGTQVLFSTTLGTLAPAAVLTELGVAVTTLTSGSVAGTAEVSAAVGQLAVSLGVPFQGGSAEVGVITLSANPTSLPADGKSTAVVWAQLLDPRGQLVADGVTVAFSTSLGSITSSATTSDGLAQATLTAASTTGTATVRAVAKGVSAETSVSLYTPASGTATPVPTPTRTPTPAGGNPVGSIQLLASPDQVPADGKSTATIWATVRDIYGNLIADGTSVSFVASLGKVTASASTTQGLAIATFTAASVTGTAEITAYSRGVTAVTFVRLVTPAATATPTPTTGPTRTPTRSS